MDWIASTTTLFITSLLISSPIASLASRVYPTRASSTILPPASSLREGIAAIAVFIPAAISSSVMIPSSSAWYCAVAAATAACRSASGASAWSLMISVTTRIASNAPILPPSFARSSNF